MGRYASEEYIRDFSTRKIIGIVRTLHNGDVEVREFSSRKILGFYRKSKNTTTDFYGHMVAKGNCAVGLIYDHYNKKTRGK